MKITDKMRLDWHGKHGQEVVAFYHHGHSFGTVAGWYVFDGSFKPGRRFTTIRQAIDAAIRAAKKPARRKGEDMKITVSCSGPRNYGPKHGIPSCSKHYIPDGRCRLCQELAVDHERELWAIIEGLDLVIEDCGKPTPDPLFSASEMANIQKDECPPCNCPHGSEAHRLTCQEYLWIKRRAKMRQQQTCALCHGTGRDLPGDEACRVCAGEGQVRK